MNPLASSATHPSSHCVLGNGAGHDEDVPDVVGLGVAWLIAPAHAFEMMTTFEGDDFGVGSEHDGRILFDAANQIARHGLRQPARPHEHVHAFRGLRQKHRGLAG